MKKSIVAFTVLGMFAGGAEAQSSVTLYGIFDAGVNYISNLKGSTSVNVTSGVAQGSRWGLNGVEDLGGGVKVLFRLENGFNGMTGTMNQGGLLFGRQVYVGLSSPIAGTLTLGRQYDAMCVMVQQVTYGAFYSGMGHPFDNDNLVDAVRLNNTVKYVSPSYSGFTLAGAYSFSNEAAGATPGSGFSDNSAVSAGASYASGPLVVAAGYLRLSNPGANTTGATVSYVPPTALIAGAISRQQAFAVGGKYDFGVVKVGLDYSHGRFDTATDHLAFNNYEAWTAYQLNPAFLLSGAYTFTDGKLGSTGGSPRYHQITLMADYFLSKQTDIYLMSLYQLARGTAPNAVIAPATYLVNTTDVSSSKTQLLVRLALRHRF